MDFRNALTSPQTRSHFFENGVAPAGRLILPEPPQCGGQISRDNRFGGRPVDVDYYKEVLDEPGLSEEQKEQIITALWQIIVAFVDLGFGVHPVQQACGKDENTHSDSAQESRDALVSSE